MSKPGVLLQHGPNGPSGLLGDFLTEKAIPHRTVAAWEEPIGDLSDVPFVVSLGSEFSAGGSTPPWVPAEIEALRGAIAADVPILGLCFGGQALALALGGGVHRTEHPEIGWVAVSSSDAEVPSGAWAQYHYELLDVPPGAEEIARSPAGPAAFRFGPHLGLQFHPEVTQVQMDEWLGMDPEVPAEVDRDAIAREGARCAVEAAERSRLLFSSWFARLP